MTPSGRRTGVLVMAYGTPASPGEVEAFYTDVRRGRPPSPEQLAQLVGRYEAIGGTSPLAEAHRRAGGRDPGRARVCVHPATFGAFSATSTPSPR